MIIVILKCYITLFNESHNVYSIWRTALAFIAKKLYHQLELVISPIWIGNSIYKNTCYYLLIFWFVDIIYLNKGYHVFEKNSFKGDTTLWVWVIEITYLNSWFYFLNTWYHLFKLVIFKKATVNGNPLVQVHDPI